jgi:hypothetical protein
MSTYCAHRHCNSQFLITTNTKCVNIIKINTNFGATAASIIRVEEQVERSTHQDSY